MSLSVKKKIIITDTLGQHVFHNLTARSFFFFINNTIDFCKVDILMNMVYTLIISLFLLFVELNDNNPPETRQKQFILRLTHSQVSPLTPPATTPSSPPKKHLLPSSQSPFVQLLARRHCDHSTFNLERVNK